MADASPTPPAVTQRLASWLANVTAPVVDPARAQAIEAAVLGLDELEDAGDLVALLAPPVNSTQTR